MLFHHIIQLISANLGLSRLFTVKKEAGIKVKNYFNDKIKPELELKIIQIKEELFEMIKQESYEIAEKNFKRIQNLQRDFESKTLKIVNECEARTKEIEVSCEE